MNIAILLTCHNRRDKTRRCLQSLKEALFLNYNSQIDKIWIEIFLTNDGCTDGTPESAKEVFSDKNILHILQGDGNLYWAGGMRFCWKEARKRHAEWDYYLLLNDDTELMPNLFDELFCAEQYSLDQFSQEGIISGITCDIRDSARITYGGDIWVNKVMAKTKRLAPNGKPQLCDLANANILLVPSVVVDKIGIFYEGYKHGKADYDYSNTARKAGIPVVLTANACGKCEHDHYDFASEAKKVTNMSLKQRKEYFHNPVHSISDYLCLVRRTSPLRLPFVCLGRLLNVYFPKLYYRLSSVRY